MFTVAGHLTYCTNIHQGETWKDHFASMKNNFPFIKGNISPDKPMGIGLRLSNKASIELSKKENLLEFKEWLTEQDAYVFTMNGFPYGEFHNAVVKGNVHKPDWTTDERVDYTNRLFQILSELLPESIDGGVSTSPLGYKLGFETKEQLASARETGTQNVIRVIENLIELHKSTGKIMHLDIEPEPDGIMETGEEFIEWFEKDLLRIGIPVIKEKSDISEQNAEELIKEHVRLCYDVCHFAIGFEPHKEIISEVQERGIKIGKIQISAALKSKMNLNERNIIKQSFENFNEPVYLHQVVAKTIDGKLLRYPDLPEAIKDIDNPVFEEWRAHFHVPIFTPTFNLLSSTQDEIAEVLSFQKTNAFTNHLEVETYTWDVLPSDLKLPMQDSITRELQWVKDLLDK